MVTAVHRLSRLTSSHYEADSMRRKSASRTSVDVEAAKTISQSSEPEWGQPIDSISSPGHFQKYFRVSLIQPQINFLDSKAHCCFVICASKSALEGVHSDTVFAIVNGEPKVQNRLTLGMEEISLFTAGDLLDPNTEEDIILWRNMRQGNGRTRTSTSTDFSMG